MVKKILFILLFATLPTFVILHSTPSSSLPATPTHTVTTVSTTDTIRIKLIEQVDSYIHTEFPKSRLSGEALVDACTEHDFDLIFALAQGRIESGFGTAGVARKTNSVWNVGAWDGHSATQIKKRGHGFEHPNHSIEPYILHVKEKYMGEKKDEKDLMRNYVTLSGYRYATSTEYESKLRTVYNRISRTELGDTYKTYLAQTE